MGWPVSGSVGPPNVGSNGATMLGFFDQVSPRSVERITATLAPRSCVDDCLCTEKTTKPSTSVRSGRTLMMLPIVPACVPGLKATCGVSQLRPPFVVRENQACCTNERAWKRPLSDRGNPGGETKRSHMAYT